MLLRKTSYTSSSPSPSGVKGTEMSSIASCGGAPDGSDLMFRRKASMSSSMRCPRALKDSQSCGSSVSSPGAGRCFCILCLLDCAEGIWPGVLGVVWTPACLESLLDVCDQVFRILDADRQANQVVTDTQPMALL